MFIKNAVVLPRGLLLTHARNDRERLLPGGKRYGSRFVLEHGNGKMFLESGYPVPLAFQIRDHGMSQGLFTHGL